MVGPGRAIPIVHRILTELTFYELRPLNVNTSRVLSDLAGNDELCKFARVLIQNIHLQILFIKVWKCFCHKLKITLAFLHVTFFGTVFQKK